MKTTIYKCDICGKETDPDEMLHTESEKDVCADCLAKLVDEHFARKEKFEEILESASANKPVKLKKQVVIEKKQLFDKGKAQALRDAGWKVPEIAKEMGVCPATVWNNTVRPEPKQKKALEFNDDDMARMGDSLL